MSVAPPPDGASRRRRPVGAHADPSRPSRPSRPSHPSRPSRYGLAVLPEPCPPPCRHGLLLPHRFPMHTRTVTDLTDRYVRACALGGVGGEFRRGGPRGHGGGRAGPRREGAGPAAGPAAVRGPRPLSGGGGGRPSRPEQPSSITGGSLAGSARRPSAVLKSVRGVGLGPLMAERSVGIALLPPPPSARQRRPQPLGRQGGRCGRAVVDGRVNGGRSAIGGRRRARSCAPRSPLPQVAHERLCVFQRRVRAIRIRRADPSSALCSRQRASAETERRSDLRFCSRPRTERGRLDSIIYQGFVAVVHIGT